MSQAETVLASLYSKDFEHKSWFMGKNLVDMTREELIGVIKHLSDEVVHERKSATEAEQKLGDYFRSNRRV